MTPASLAISVTVMWEYGFCSASLMKACSKALRFLTNLLSFETRYIFFPLQTP